MRLRINSFFVPVFAVLAVVQLAMADDVAVTMSNVHLCCQKCVKGVAKATDGIDGLKATADMDAKTVLLAAPDKATLQKGVDALTKAGFFGTSSDPSIKVDATTGAKGEMVTSLKIEGLHLCCGTCVKAVNRILKTVPGVTTNDATIHAASFTVTGNFKDSDVMTAFQKEGLTGKIAQ